MTRPTILEHCKHMSKLETAAQGPCRREFLRSIGQTCQTCSTNLNTLQQGSVACSASDRQTSIVCGITASTADRKVPRAAKVCNQKGKSCQIPNSEVPQLQLAKRLALRTETQSESGSLRNCANVDSVSIASPKCKRAAKEAWPTATYVC